MVNPLRLDRHPGDENLAPGLAALDLAARGGRLLSSARRAVPAGRLARPSFELWVPHPSIWEGRGFSEVEWSIEVEYPRDSLGAIREICILMGGRLRHFAWHFVKRARADPGHSFGA